MFIHKITFLIIACNCYCNKSTVDATHTFKQNSVFFFLPDSFFLPHHNFKLIKQAKFFLHFQTLVSTKMHLQTLSHPQPTAQELQCRTNNPRHSGVCTVMRGSLPLPCTLCRVAHHTDWKSWVAVSTEMCPLQFLWLRRVSVVTQTKKEDPVVTSP